MYFTDSVKGLPERIQTPLSSVVQHVKQLSGEAGDEDADVGDAAEQPILDNLQ